MQFSYSELYQVAGSLGENSDPEDLEVVSHTPSSFTLQAARLFAHIVLKKETVVLMGENQQNPVPPPDVHPPFSD